MTTTDRSTAVGVFTEQALAEEAIEELNNAGFTNEQIGFIMPQRHHGAAIFTSETETPDALTAPMAQMGAMGLGGGTPYGAGPGASIAPLVPSEMSYDEIEGQNDTAAGATAGAVSGGVLGGLLGAAAALLIPGLGPVIAGGILAATLGGAAIGALAGGLVGALTHLGVPEEEARYYQDELNAGKTIVTVHTRRDRFEEAVAILREKGAVNASARSEGDIDMTTETRTQAIDTTTPVDMYAHKTQASDGDPIENTTASTNVAMQTARTGMAVNATTQDMTGPQAAYEPTIAQQKQKEHEIVGDKQAGESIAQSEEVQGSAKPAEEEDS